MKQEPPIKPFQSHLLLFKGIRQRHRGRRKSKGEGKGLVHSVCFAYLRQICCLVSDTGGSSWQTGVLLGGASRVRTHADNFRARYRRILGPKRSKRATTSLCLCLFPPSPPLSLYPPPPDPNPRKTWPTFFLEEAWKSTANGKAREA